MPAVKFVNLAHPWCKEWSAVMFDEPERRVSMAMSTIKTTRFYLFSCGISSRSDCRIFMEDTVQLNCLFVCYKLHDDEDPFWLFPQAILALKVRWGKEVARQWHHYFRLISLLFFALLISVVSLSTSFDPLEQKQIQNSPPKTVIF